MAEQTPLAIKYKNKSIAEQHSLSVSLDLLEEEPFRELLATICPTLEEKLQLRRLVITVVMATDIVSLQFFLFLAVRRL